MKNFRKTALAAVLFLTLTIMVKAPVYADNTTVTGTVGKETKDNLLYLTTSGGTMQIKIDSDTDMSGCRVILPGSSLTAEVYYGSDAYMHAAKITGGTVGPNVTVDRSNPSTVQGTITDGTTSELLYLSTSNGTMQIKLDTDTDMSGCRVIMLGKSVQISCARGSDAYMHALSVIDSASASASYSNNSSGSSSSSSASFSNYPQTSGKLDEDSDLDRLIINDTKYYIEPETDFSGCKAIINGRSVTVAYYKGLDGKNHAVAVKDSSSTNATVSSNTIATVQGKITTDSKTDTLYFKTSDGVMQIRIDNSTNTSQSGVLYEGKTVKITVAHGSDEYLHAVTVTDR